MSIGFHAPAQAAGPDPEKVMGPKECSECHKKETTAWQSTHHFTTFRNMPRSDRAREIADKMKIKRVKAESLCLDCHFTNQIEGGKPKPIAGISCESCHSAAKDWMDTHSKYSGKTKATETAAERTDRWAKSEKAGMIRPSQYYKLAKNCYSCHVVPEEKLVNVGDHPAGSNFELVSWSQGEVRHNFLKNGDPINVNEPASTEHKRMLFIIGMVVELETALRAVAKATENKSYAQSMAKRANTAGKKLGAVAKLLPDVKELANMVALIDPKQLKLNNEGPLTEAADKISIEALALSMNHDGSAFGVLDRYIPGPEKYKGKASQ